jgi:hypothetical protein
MNSRWVYRIFVVFGLSICLQAPDISRGNNGPVPPSPGNVIIGGPLMPPGTAIHEYTPDGTYVQVIPIEHPTNNDSPGQFLFDRAGGLWIFNGDLQPYVSSWSPDTDSWAHMTCPEWNTFLCFPCQGLGINKNYVFATDMGVLGDANGIVRFDRQSMDCNRFAQGTDYSAISVVGGGPIYALRADTSSPPAPSVVDVFDPASLTLLKSMELSVRSLAIAVDANDILHGANGTDILRFDENGNVMDAHSVIDEGFIYTLSRANDGRFVAVSNWGEVVIMDADLTPQSRFYNIAGTFGYAALVPERPPQNGVAPVPVTALSVTALWVLITSICAMGLFVVFRRTPVK